MGKTTATINPYKYCNRTALDGSSLKPGEVLVPHWLQDGYKLSPEAKKHCTTFHFGEFKFRIGFMPIRIECYETYMEGFNREINQYVCERREGRCVIGHKPNGEPICCPKCNLCTGCPEKYEHERYNPLKDQYQFLSLDYCYEDEDFDYADENAVDPEAYVIAQEEAAESDKDFRTKVIAKLRTENARHAQIVELELDGKSVDEIIVAIKLKSSRGHEVINEANDHLCDLLKAPHMKTKHRK